VSPFSVTKIPVDWPKIVQIKPSEWIFVGGEDNSVNSEDPPPLNTCFILNTETHELKKIASMKKARIAHSVCYLKCSNGVESVFAIGGFDEDEQEGMDSMERFDVKTGKWDSDVKKLPRACYATTAIAAD
jgi:hypothetical protein